MIARVGAFAATLTELLEETFFLGTAVGRCCFCLEAVPRGRWVRFAEMEVLEREVALLLLLLLRSFFDFISGVFGS